MTNVQPHIRCSNKDAAAYAIMPGDPERVDRVKSFLENSVDIAFNREFKSCTGFYKGVKVMVISTGIGGASTGIAVEELKNIGVHTLIRIGSCGALQPSIKLGDLIIANGAVRDEGTSKAYVAESYPAVPDTGVLISLIESAKELDFNYYCGKIRSHDSFYTDKEQETDEYWSGKGILGSDMESAALFVIGGLRNLKTASVLNVVVESNGNLASINSYVDGESLTALGEKKEILTVLEAIVKLEKNK
ncbi:MAG TPA: nucleoside phosphorylase [Clostridium sp.]